MARQSGFRRKTGVLLVVLAGLAGTARPAAADPPKRKLDELIDLARRRSKTIGVAKAELAVRESQRRMANWLWTPMGDVTYAFTGAPRIECRGPGNNADPNVRVRECVDTVDPNTGQSVSAVSSGIGGVGMQAEVNLLQPLYTFGKIESAIDAARHGVDAAKAGVEGARWDAEVDVTRAYWAAKGARTAMETLSSVRGELDPWIKKIEKDLDRPKPEYSFSDLQRLKVALDDLDVLQADLARTRLIALAGLRALVGEDVDEDEDEMEPVNDPLQTITWYETEAARHRPEVRALDAGAAAFHSLARLRRSELLPDVGITTNVLLRYTSSVETPDNVFMWQATVVRFGVFLALRQPLDFFQKWSRYKNAQADASLFEAKRTLALTGMDFEIRIAYAEQEEARRRLAATDHGQHTARGWLTAVKQTLDLGTADPRDLADAARRYVELRLRYLLAIVDVNVSAARLRRVAGVIR